MKQFSKMIVLMLLIITTFIISLIPVFAETENGILLGDTDLDGEVSVLDATAIQLHLVEIDILSDDNFLAADINSDGEIDITEATAIQMYLVDLDCEYPIGTIIKPKVEETIPSTEPPTQPPTEKPTTPPVLNDYAPIDSDNTDVVSAQMLWEIEQGFHRLVNEERKSKGLNTLSYNKHLDSVAQIRSSEIIESFSHTRPNGKTFYSIIDLKKYNYSFIGENIAIVHSKREGFTGSKEEIEYIYTTMFETFKNSPGHYANMTHKDFKDTGIGISYKWNEKYNRPGFYISHYFGQKMK